MPIPSTITAGPVRISSWRLDRIFGRQAVRLCWHLAVLMPIHRYPREPLLRSGLVRLALALLILAAGGCVAQSVMAASVQPVCVIPERAEFIPGGFQIQRCEGTWLIFYDVEGEA